MHQFTRSSMTYLLGTLALLFSLTNSQIETLSIGDDYPHRCVNNCLYGGNVYQGIENNLGCAIPVANRCYCPTAAASSTKLDSFINACATSFCGAGDVTEDVSAMKSIYAAYCSGAGFSAIAGWIVEATTTPDMTPQTTAAPAAGVSRSTTASTPTTTQLTVVTAVTDASSGTHVTQVTVQATSTQWVNKQGGLVSGPNTGPTYYINKTAIGVAVGVTVPAIIALVAIGICLCRRRRRRRRNAALYTNSHQNQDQPPPPAQETSQIIPPTPSKAPEVVVRKPVVASPVLETVSPISMTTELSGGEGVRREISGREVHPFPDRYGGPPVVVPGQYEADGRQMSPPPAYAQPSGTGRGQQHWELP